MQCRHCGAQIDAEAAICPNCCMSVQKPKKWQIVLGAALAVVVAAALTLVIMKDQGVDLSGLKIANWFSKKDAVVETTAPTQQTQESMEPVFNYELNRDSYTASAEDPAGQAAKVVAKIGDVELTNGELQSYYWYATYNFISEYESYLAYYGADLSQVGLDVTKPLDQQLYPQSNETWQRIFLENAITEWHKYSSLALQAQKEGFQMREEMTKKYDELIAKAEQTSKDEGYASLDEMLKDELGPLSSVEGYKAYLWTYHYAMDYFDYKYNQMEPTDEEVEAYYEENKDSLTFDKETKEYAVRHILIEPKNGTPNADGTTTYSEEAWEACRVEAQGILDKWLSGDGTEEGFAALASEKSTDGGSASNGGLYEGLNAETSFVTEFKEWYMDPARKVGDSGLIKTTYGYHIMYMSAADTVWQDECKVLIWQANAESFVKQCMEQWPVTLYDDQIAIGEVNLGA